jgi:GT2 family glycosyltransferase
MTVAILVLNWNGWRDTIECLESLFRLDYPAFSVVLCDNASTDGSTGQIIAWARGDSLFGNGVEARLRHLSDPPVPKPIELVEYSRQEAESGVLPPTDAPLILIHNGSNGGFAGGTNVGLRYLYSQPRFKYVWVLNNDIVVAPDSLRHLVEGAEATDGLGGAGATLFEYREPDVVQIAGGGVFQPWRGFPRPLTRLRSGSTASVDLETLDYVSGGCMLAPLAQLARIGTIDEGYFMYGEDVDLSLRIRRAGLSLAHIPRAHAWHKGGGATGYGNPRHDYYIVRNNLHLVKKYFPRMLPVTLAYAIYRSVLPKIVRGQWRRLGAVWRAFRDFRAGVVGPLPVTSSINLS